ncbi:MAG: aromatic amino acid lyase [Candidatus Riflebacteria bacterium]|nr:aromatic amino acid lyase [Candidatus Riflebacteria bacterium]
MSIVVGDRRLTIDDVVRVARHGETVELSPAAVERIKTCRGMLTKKIAAREIMYGVNTGIGELSEVVLTDEQVEQFQRYLIYNHAAGFGEPCPVEHVRAAMFSRIAVHAQGHSGCRPDITRTYVEMLNKGVTPVACEKGSVGACGDLSPMSQVALSLLGEGECFYKGERMPARQAMERSGIAIPGLHARDGLAAINGSNLINGIGCLVLHDAERWIKQAEIAAAMALEALLANMKPYQARLHELRGFRGAITSAANLRAVMNGSDLATGKLKVKVQDAYSMRSTPQVIGALRDSMRFAREQFEIELNGVADNPIFCPGENIVLTGANFQGSPMTLPLDTVAAGVTMVSVLSERRLNRLLNSALSVGLPPFLTKGAGMFSGLMLSQYTADTLIVEQRILSAPSCVQSIPAAADQEDFVSMGMNSALKSRQILKNAHAILGIELIAAAQALDFREFGFGAGTRAARTAVRRVVAHLDEDRPLFTDHNNMSVAVERCEILDAVEKEIGPLGSSW